MMCYYLNVHFQGQRVKGNDVITGQANGTNGRATSRLHLGRLAAQVQEPRKAQAEKEQ